MCVCVREREGLTGFIVCVCVRERDSLALLCVCVRERERGTHWLYCVCVCERERDSLALLLYNVYWLQETGLSARGREKEIDKNTKK